MGRFPLSAKRYELPPAPPPQRRGAPRHTGDLRGSPPSLAQTAPGWEPPPSAAGAERQAGDGLGHPVLPGRLLRRVVIRRQGEDGSTRTDHRPPPVEAFCTTELAVSPQDMRAAYRDRWPGEMASRDATACAGWGPAPCRKRQRIVGAHTVRLVRAAARTLWLIDQVDRGTGGPLCRYRPWDRQKVAPSSLDVAAAWRAALQEAGIVPLPRFTPEWTENDEEPEHALPLAA